MGKVSGEMEKIDDHEYYKHKDIYSYILLIKCFSSMFQFQLNVSAQRVGLRICVVDDFESTCHTTAHYNHQHGSHLVNTCTHHCMRHFLRKTLTISRFGPHTHLKLSNVWVTDLTPAVLLIWFTLLLV